MSDEIKTFTQEEVNQIVKDRLDRVKTEKPADYDDLQEITKELADYGYTGSPAEIKATIKQQKEQAKKQQELQDLQDEAEKDGINPALAKKIKDLEDKLDQKTKALDEIVGERQAKKTESEKEKLQEENYQLQRKELLEKHEIDADDLEKNAKFMKFVKGKSGINLVEEYEDFTEFIGEAETEAIKKVMSKESRSTSGGKGSGPDGSYGLNNSQKELAKNNGMTNKEYAELLQNVQ